MIFAGAGRTWRAFFRRRDGKSLGQMAREEIGPVGGVAALIAVFAIMIILLAVLALVVVNALAQSPWGVFSIAMTIPIALFMGFYMRVLRPGRVLETTAIGVGLLMLAIVAGGWVDDSSWADTFRLSPETLAICLVIYGFFASVLPVWLLLAPRDYLSTFMKVGVILLLAVGIVVTSPLMENEAVTKFASERRGAGVRRRAVSVRVHHDRLRRAVGLPRADRLRARTPRWSKGVPDPHDRLRRMLRSPFVAVLRVIAASISDPGLYYAMNARRLSATACSPPRRPSPARLLDPPGELQGALRAVDEQSLVARTAAAPTLAIACRRSFGVFGSSLQASSTTSRSCSRRCSSSPRRRRDTRRRSCCGHARQQSGEPLGASPVKPGLFSRARSGRRVGLLPLQPASRTRWAGSTSCSRCRHRNQLLGAVALAVCTTLLIKHGKAKWAWVTGLPLAWDWS